MALTVSSKYHVEGTYNTRDNQRQGTSWMWLGATLFLLSIWQDSSKYTLKSIYCTYFQLYWVGSKNRNFQNPSTRMCAESLCISSTLNFFLVLHETREIKKRKLFPSKFCSSCFLTMGASFAIRLASQKSVGVWGFPMGMSWSLTGPSARCYTWVRDISTGWGMILGRNLHSQGGEALKSCGCPTLGSVEDQAGWGLEHPYLLEVVSSQGRELELDDV